MTAKAWLRPKDIAAELGVTKRTAGRLIRRIPGAELLYRHEGGERWRVSREAYDAWRKSQMSQMSQMSQKSKN